MHEDGTMDTAQSTDAKAAAGISNSSTDPKAEHWRPNDAAQALNAAGEVVNQGREAPDQVIEHAKSAAEQVIVQAYRRRR
jgi:hypothetical protein